MRRTSDTQGTSRRTGLNWALTLLFVGLIAFDLKRFSVWTQILLLEDADPVHLFNQFHAHTFRYSLMLPVIRLADYLGVDRDRVFSFAVCAMMIAVARLVASAAALCRSEAGAADSGRAYAPVMLAFMTVSLVMNGRLVFAFLGMAIICRSQVAWVRGVRKSALTCVFEQMLGVVLMSVSSGAFVVGVATVLSLLVYVPVGLLGRDARHLRLLLFVGVPVFGVQPFVDVVVKKNLDMFGTGWDAVFAMLDHGPGVFLRVFDDVVLAFVGLAPLAALVAFAAARAVVRRYQEGANDTPLIMAIAIALAVGVFGYSTLLTGLVPAVALVAARLVFPQEHSDGHRTLGGPGFGASAPTLRSSLESRSARPLRLS